MAYKYEFKGTPGLWNMEKGILHLYIENDTGYDIAKLDYDENYHSEAATAIRNARAIAAVPDLLEALWLIVQKNGRGKLTGNTAIAALKKAGVLTEIK